MSTNIQFQATRDIQVVKTGAVEQQTEFFPNVWQTPTRVTERILHSADPIQAYKDWVLDGQEDQVEDVYATDDPFCEGPVVGQRTFNYGTEHCKEFDKWIKDVTDRGFEITTISW